MIHPSAAATRAALLCPSIVGLVLICAPATVAAVAEASTAPTLGEVVVTARRREESAQTVPIALSVVGAEALSRVGAANVAVLPQLVPTLQVLSTNPRNTAITIRGLGASYGLANDGLEQGVGVYVDQVYNSRPATATFDFVDIDRVEVLRGPQGTLFGKNTTAGALNITTRAPSFAPELQAELSGGDHSFGQVKVSASNALIADVLAVRVSAVGTTRNGLIRDVTTGHLLNNQQHAAVRGQVLFKPTHDLNLRLFIDYSRQRDECCGQVFYGYGQTLKPTAQQYPALAAGLNYAPASVNPYALLVDLDSPVQARQTQRGVAGVIDWNLGFATLTSVTAVRDWTWDPASDRDYTALDIVRQSANPSVESQTSQEVRLASNGKRRLDWVVGVFYFDQDVITHGITQYGAQASYWLLPGSGQPAALLNGYTIYNNSAINTRSLAGFGQATLKITDRLRVTPGLRWTQEDKTGAYVATVQGGLANPTASQLSKRLGIARPQAYSATTSNGALTGQVAVSYDVTDAVHAYFTFARGEKSGGINMSGLPTTAAGDPALVSAVVRPEKDTTYELGVKSTLFRRRLTADLAVFNTDVTDFQANVVDSGPGALRGYLANVARVRVRGIEGDLATRPMPGVTAYASLAYTDGVYGAFANGPCPLERIGASTSACDLSGRPLPGVSAWAGAAGAEYRRPVRLVGADGEAYLGVDASFRSSYYADAADSDYLLMKPYELVNLRLGFAASRGWEAFIWAHNLFDRRYMQNLTVQTGNSGFISGTPGDPRTVGVTVRARY